MNPRPRAPAAGFPASKAPRPALNVIDGAIQVYGGAGVSADRPLAEMWANVRTLRIADGPDEVHVRSVARRELAKLLPTT